MERSTTTPSEIIKNWPAACFGVDSIVEFRGTTANNTTFARGAFGEISLAVFRGDPDGGGDHHRDYDTNHRRRHRPRWVAVKMLAQATTTSGCGMGMQPKQRYRLNLDVAQELHALLTLHSHPHIVSLLALYTPPGAAAGTIAHGQGALCMALEYCPTDLHLTLEWRRRSLLPLLSINVIQMIAQDLFAALSHCHSHDVVHGDIKPGNLLVSSSGRVQLCDFGLAQCLHCDDDNDNRNNNNANQPSNCFIHQRAQHPAMMPRGLCTLAYRPPEILLQSSAAATHAAAGDVWSAAVVLAELVRGKTLFPGTNDLSQFSLLIRTLGPPSESFLATLPLHCQQLLQSSSTTSLSASSINHGNPNNINDHARQQQQQSHDWIDQAVPRAAETPALWDTLRTCLVWDARHRPASAPEAVRQCGAWLQSHGNDENDSDRVDNDDWQRRQQVLEQVLPPALEEAFLLLQSPQQQQQWDGQRSSARMATAQQQAQTMAKTRRTFLRNLNVWSEQ